jgi:enoyl-CoA hydratase/carnithine racemase
MMQSTHNATSTSSIVLEDVAEHVVQIRLDRPERLNAMSVEMVIALKEACASVATSKARVLLVRGTGRAFCAGADLKERRGMAPPQRIEHNAAINDAVNALAQVPLVTVAVINGLALGGGCELALACDLRVAAAGIRIGLTESRIGVIPGAGGTQRLPRLIGVARALEMMLTGEPVSAERAEAIGLVNAVVDAEQLDARAAALARLLATRSPGGLRTIKHLVYDGCELSLAEGLANERKALVATLGTEDYAEGLAAFAEKRPPRFADAKLP